MSDSIEKAMRENDERSLYDHFRLIGLEHFGRSVFKKVWDKSEWAEFESYYQKKESDYYEILNRLKGQEKENFHFDYLDRLQEQHDYQNRRKFKKYLAGLISKLESDFEKKDQ